jgi:hypothetical protein
MKRKMINLGCLRISLFICMIGLIVFSCQQETKKKLALNKWTYIEVDSSRQKFGDWDEPEWLRYFGLDMQDINGDNYTDVVSGRYIYLNPGSDMASAWTRINVGLNVDGMLFIDVDHDDQADIIAEALPDVYWLEATDKEGSAWKALKIGQIPKTGHVNGQGYGTADLVKGGDPEIILTAADGIYVCQVPSVPQTDKWQWIRIAETRSDEGVGVGDLDGDGDLDIAAGDIEEGEMEHPTNLFWWENPGSLEGDWQKHTIGKTNHAIDRVKIADINGDKKIDIVISEERWPGLEADASLYWFEAPQNPQKTDWKRHTVVVQYSMNNLDVADIDQDGDADIVTNEHKGTDLHLQIWENDGKGVFTKHVIDKGKEMHLGAQLADLDGDGDLDIIGHAWDNYKYLHLWRNDAIGN